MKTVFALLAAVTLSGCVVVVQDTPYVQSPPVYYKSEYDTLNPLTVPWVEIVDEDDAERNDELNSGKPIICIG